MWHSTQTGAAPVQYGDSYIPGQQHRPTDTSATTTSAAATPRAKRVAINPDSAPSVPQNVSHTLPIDGKTGIAICFVLAGCWFVFLGQSGDISGAGTGAAKLVTDQAPNIVFENAVNEARTMAFEQAAPGYIERFAPVAIQEMDKFGIPASISLAQGLLESRAGTSRLAVATNNHFGIKCMSKSCKKGHCKNFTDDTHKDFFRNYPDGPWGSWRAHSILLSNGRYKKLNGLDWKGWADGLQNLGYATDQRYAAALKGIIQRYELHRFDN